MLNEGLVNIDTSDGNNLHDGAGLIDYSHAPAGRNYVAGRIVSVRRTVIASRVQSAISSYWLALDDLGMEVMTEDMVPQNHAEVVRMTLSKNWSLATWPGHLPKFRMLKHLIVQHCSLRTISANSGLADLCRAADNQHIPQQDRDD